MQIETALFFESTEQIYERVFLALKPRSAVPQISVQYRKYANTNSRVRLAGNKLQVDISDLLESAPAPIQEALAFILLSKLFGKQPDARILARYRHYLNRADIRRTLHAVRHARGRKTFLAPQGETYDLVTIFEELNCEFFHGLMARPLLGWSRRASRTVLGHYDPSHNAIVLTKLLDSSQAKEQIVRYVMFHEMLHLRHPTQHHAQRRCIHTREFKEAERQFPGYRQVRLELRKFVSDLDNQAV